MVNMTDLGAEADINKEINTGVEAETHEQADLLTELAAEAKRLAQLELDRQADQAKRVADSAAAELQRQVDLNAAPDACVWQRHADAAKASQAVATSTVEAVKYVGPGSGKTAKKTVTVLSPNKRKI